MRLSIDHVTGFRYDGQVHSSYNEARMTPINTPTQTVWSTRLEVEPAPWQRHWTDYWGTQVTTFEVHEPHDTLTVHAHAVVDTHVRPAGWPDDRTVPAQDLAWDGLTAPKVIDKLAEYLGQTPRTRPPAELAEAVAALRDRPPRLAALDACRLIGDRVTYAPGATEVHSTAEDAWTGAQGVCQDFSHLAIGAVRSLGIPARYVSGYLHPEGEAAEAGVPHAAESHSWLEWWCGTWVAFDPTNMGVVGEQYVRVGHGRDYTDVSPLRGTYSGGASTMFVEVTMTQLR